jgi:hypothetical protein
LENSPINRGPAMSCGEPFVEASFTISYPAADVDAATKDSIDYVSSALDTLGWPGCKVTVDEVEEIDIEAELQEGYTPPQ